MNEDVTNFYTKNSDKEDYLSNYIKSHSPRCKWVMERFGMDKLEHKRVLAIGDGVGMNLQYLHSSNESVNLDGALIPNGKRLGSFLNLRVDLNQEYFGLLFDNEPKFDIAIACEVVEHVSNINNLMLQLKRLLRENAICIFTIPHETVTHPTSLPGIFFPEDRFVEYIEQWGFLVEDHDIYKEGWWTCCFKCRNAPINKARPRYFKNEAKFINSTPIEWPNL